MTARSDATRNSKIKILEKDLNNEKDKEREREEISIFIIFYINRSCFLQKPS
jgi:hypothetical protein